MTLFNKNRNRPSNRRGAALIFAVVMMFLLFGMLAFSIDTGFLAQSKAEAVRAADSAALAGCWELYKEMESDPNLQLDSRHSHVASKANEFALMNPINTSDPSLSPFDVKVGYLASLRNSIVSRDNDLPFIGVRVKLHKNDSLNGSIPFYFGKIFGLKSKELSVESTAVMARSVSGFYSHESGASNLDILPFALDQETWDAMMAASESGNGGQDNYRYSLSTEHVTSGGDGIQEVNLYPQGTGSPGNRGTVDIGGANNSTNDIARQILHGISSNDLAALGKPLALDLDTGTMTLNGDTGISAGVKDELQSIVGQKRIIPLFSLVTGNGNNAVYTITKWVGVRVMYVKLTGSMNSKRVIVQPAPIVVRQGIWSDNQSSSDFVLAPVVLAQ